MSPLSPNSPPPPAHVERYDYEGLREQQNPFGPQSNRCADAQCIKESFGDRNNQPATPVNVSTSPVSPVITHGDFKNPVRQNVLLYMTPPNIPYRFPGYSFVLTSSIEESQAISRSEIMQGLRGEADSIASEIRFCVENVLLLILDPDSPEDALEPLDEISPMDRKKRTLYRPASEYREYALGMATSRKDSDIAFVTARILARFGAEVEKVISGDDGKVAYTLVMFLLDRISKSELELKGIESVSAPMRVHVQKRSTELAKVREVTRSSIVRIVEAPKELEELEKLLGEKHGREKLAVMEKIKMLRAELAKKLEFLNGNMDEDDLGRVFKNKGKEAAYRKFQKMKELRRIDDLMHRMRGVTRTDAATGRNQIYIGKLGLSRFAHRLIALGIISESEWENANMDANIVDIFRLLMSALEKKKEALLDELGIKRRSRKRKDENDPEEGLRKSMHSLRESRQYLESRYSEFELEKDGFGKGDLRLSDFCIERGKFGIEGDMRGSVNLEDACVNMTGNERDDYEKEYQSELTGIRDGDEDEIPLDLLAQEKMKEEADRLEAEEGLAWKAYLAQKGYPDPDAPQDEDDDDVIPATILSTPQSDTQSATGTL